MWVGVWGGRHHGVATLGRAEARHPQRQLRVAAVELSSLPPVLPPLWGAAQSGAQVSGGEVGERRGQGQSRGGGPRQRGPRDGKVTSHTPVAGPTELLEAIAQTGVGQVAHCGLGDAAHQLV